MALSCSASTRSLRTPRSSPSEKMKTGRVADIGALISAHRLVIHNKRALGNTGSRGQEEGSAPKISRCYSGNLGLGLLPSCGREGAASQGKEHLPSAGVSEVLRSSSLEG